MPARYTPLPTQRSALDADRELDEAFESDDEDGAGVADLETTPLNRSQVDTQPVGPEASTPISGAYDFEREYDYGPPPGSPPRPSAFAIPNEIGNSNGQLPTSPLQLAGPRPSFFRRAVGALLPTHYVRVPTESQSGLRGGGNDGVFANVSAKPQRARTMRTADGDIYMVPEDSSQKEAPPVSCLLSSHCNRPDDPQSYADAQSDSSPPYWETTGQSA